VKKGFTLVELIVVIALIIASGAVVFANLAGKRSTTDLTAATQQIGVLLRQAQSDAVEQESDVAWGVHFANPTGTAPFYALFTTSYSAGTVVGTPYLLPTTVAYTTSTLAPGATLDVIFSPISGAPSTSTSIGLYMPGQNAAFSSAISISPSGEVSY
jgi:prepilin-type N-terminal cleavage/methylation domain-containing protein